MVEIDEEKLKVLTESISDQSFWDDLLKRYPSTYDRTVLCKKSTPKERLLDWGVETFVQVVLKLFPELAEHLMHELEFHIKDYD